jgi:hypothetical protein
VCAVSYVLAFLGWVALVQGVAWLAAAAASKERLHLRARVGMLLAPAGVAMFALGVLGALVPGFWG